MVARAALLIVEDNLRRRAAHLDFRAHPLQTRGKRFNLSLLLRRPSLQLRDSPLLFLRFAALLLHRAVLFEEFVEQHRVYRFVAHGVNFALAVVSHQVGIDLFYLLGHEAELRDAVWIKLMLVAEGHRFQRQDRFARFVHRLDLVLESLRGRRHPKLTAGAYNNCCACNRYSMNASNKCGGVRSCRADADVVGLSCRALAADVDVVTPRGQVVTRYGARGDVVAPRGVVVECSKTDGHVEVAGCVPYKRTIAAGCVVRPDGIVSECVNTGRRVFTAGRVTKKGKTAGGRVVAAGGVATECIITVGRVEVAGGVAQERFNTVGRVEVAGGVAKERAGTVGRVGATGCVAQERAG